MKFYRISRNSPAPNAGLRGEHRGDVEVGGRIVRDIIPGSYSIDVWDSGRRWPDLLHSLDCMIWSERVVAAFRENNLSGVDFYPQSLREVDSKVLRRLPDPRYYWAHALTGFPAVPGYLDVYPKTKDGYIDTAAFDFNRVFSYQIDGETGFYDLSKKAGLCLWKFDFTDWRGEDVFYVSSVHARFRFCTERFKGLVEAHKFSNFAFTEALDPEGRWFLA